MKKQVHCLYLLLIFLTSCAQTQVSTPQAPTYTPIFVTKATNTPIFTPTMKSATPGMIHTLIPTYEFRDDLNPFNVFKPSKDCPNICWLGIHPGTTPTGQAFTILKNSKIIREVELFGNSIQASWFLDNSSGSVSLPYSDGVIQSMSLSVSAKVGDFIGLLGEPDVLKINNDCNSNTNEIDCTGYTLFYSALNTALYIPHGNANGPSPNDFVNEITVNFPVPDYQYMQAWLGYERIDIYSQKPIPTRLPFPLP